MTGTAPSNFVEEAFESLCCDAAEALAVLDKYTLLTGVAYHESFKTSFASPLL
jgi:hypothetical protein